MNEFDKTLTKQERDAETYLEWSNETLGRCVKFYSKKLLEKDIKGFESIKTMAAAYTLIHVANEFNAGEMKQTIGGFTIKDEPTGDWEIIVRRKKAKGK